MLTEEQVEEFKRNGFLVIEDVFTEKEVNNARREFHHQLQSLWGINHAKVLCGDQAPPPGIRV